MERGGGGGGYTRWTMLGLAVFSYQGLSFCDNFGIFSSEVKSQFELTQDQLNSIATAGFWPNLLGAAIVPGLVNDRFGAPVTMVGAGVFTSAGLGGFWLTVTGRLPVLMGSPHTQLMLLQGLTSWGLQWPSAAVMPANMKAFPAHMEPVNSVCVVALLKCVSSVGGCLSVQLYLAFLAPDQTAYILFLAVSALVIFVPGAALLKTFPAPTTLDDDFRRFVPTFAVVIVVVSASIWNAHMAAGLSRAVRGAFAAALLGAFSLIGLTLVYDTRSFLGRSRGQVRADATTPLLLSGQAEPLKSVAPHRSAAAAPQQQQLQQGFTVQDDPRLSATALPVQQQHVEAEEAHTGSSPAVYGELTVWRTMATIDCWLMVLCTFATMASVNVFTVNIAQICEAIGVASATPFVMTLYSAGSAVGRLGSTLIAEALRRHGHPRSYSFMFMCVDMLVAQLVLATSSYPGTRLQVTATPHTPMDNPHIATAVPGLMLTSARPFS